jgi:hypothetical protein
LEDCAAFAAPHPLTCPGAAGGARVDCRSREWRQVSVERNPTEG